MLFVRRSETSCLKNPGRSTENSVLWKRGNLHYIWQDTLIYERNTWHALLQCRRRTWLTEKSQHVQTRSLLFYPKIPVFWGERENSNKLSVLLYYLFLFLLRLFSFFLCPFLPFRSPMRLARFSRERPLPPLLLRFARPILTENTDLSWYV